MPLPPGFTEIPQDSQAGTPPPGFSEDQGQAGWKDIVKDALNEARMGDGSKMRALMTDPVTQAKALPYLAGAGLSVMGIPGGATMGTVGGRQLSNAALRAYGKSDEIPSNKSQVAEGLLSAAGDLTAVPALNRKIFGGQIGAAEARAGVPPVQDIPSTPMALGQKTVGEFINDAVDSVKSSGGEGTPAYWKQIKDQVDRIYKLEKDQPLTGLDRGRLKWLNTQVQGGLNAAVPGRAAPAADLAMSQTLPNMITKGVQAVPSSVRSSIGWGAGEGIAGVLGYGIAKKLGLIGGNDR